MNLISFFLFFSITPIDGMRPGNKNSKYYEYQIQQQKKKKERIHYYYQPKNV